jgi:4-hydroxybenzoate polyprenyltransferase
LRSTAILFGDRGRSWVGSFYLLTVIAWSIGGWMLSMSLPYFIGMALLALHLGWQAWRLDISRPALNLSLFRANIWTGVLLLLSSVAGTI